MAIRDLMLLTNWNTPYYHTQWHNRLSSRNHKEYLFKLMFFNYFFALAFKCFQIIIISIAWIYFGCWFCRCFFISLCEMLPLQIFVSFKFTHLFFCKALQLFEGCEFFTDFVFWLILTFANQVYYVIWKYFPCFASFLLLSYIYLTGTML